MFTSVRNALIGAGAIAAFRYLANLKKLSEAIRTQLVDISLKRESGVTASYLSAKLNIVNPTSSAVEVKRVTGVVSYDGQILANFISNKPFKIIPGSENNFTLNFSVANASLIDALVKSAIQRNIFRLEIKYKLFVGAMPIMPITQRIVIDSDKLL